MAGRQLESSFTQICSKIFDQISDTHNHWYLSIKKIKIKIILDKFTHLTFTTRKYYHYSKLFFMRKFERRMTFKVRLQSDPDVFMHSTRLIEKRLYLMLLCFINQQIPYVGGNMGVSFLSYFTLGYKFFKTNKNLKIFNSQKNIIIIKYDHVIFIILCFCIDFLMELKKKWLIFKIMRFFVSLIFGPKQIMKLDISLVILI